METHYDAITKNDEKYNVASGLSFVGFLVFGAISIGLSAWLSSALPSIIVGCVSGLCLILGCVFGIVARYKRNQEIREMYEKRHKEYLENLKQNQPQTNNNKTTKTQTNDQKNTKEQQNKTNKNNNSEDKNIKNLNNTHDVKKDLNVKK